MYTAPELICLGIDYEWKYTFARDVFSIITERTLTAEAPTYETVLELDRLVRAKTLPAYLNVFLGREDENCTPSIYMRGLVLSFSGASSSDGMC